EPLAAGRIEVAGRPAGRSNRDIGYIQQQRRLDARTPLRARDVVRQGLDGHRWGIARPGRVPWGRVRAALAAVDATNHADVPVGLLSGGEQQRVRVAQAIVADPALLLCDEPLLSLDVSSQQTIAGLVDRRRREHGTAVLFVTHEINPILPYVDRILYLVDGRFRLGTPAEVLTSETLSELYRSPVEVIRRDGLVLVAGLPAPADAHGTRWHDDGLRAEPLVS
ncbi:metal ABC transporter ATP-binding protein, partial [Nostocoides japonicum]|uniref:metal ABC transporter ATP-binding protein n=1 Tax=Nostocoides japonicum TaxID=99481 RepID=UPI00065BCBC7